MKTTAFAYTAAAALTVSALALSGCTTAHTQVSWEDDNTPKHTHQHQDWWNYQFVYYPKAQVYFEPYSETYYWFANGIWNEGPVLPSRFVISNETPRVVKLESRYPYMHHHTVAKSFALNIQPYAGSDFCTTPKAFSAYMARYDDAVNDGQTQWAQSNADQYFATPFGSPFQPFRFPADESMNDATANAGDNAESSSENNVESMQFEHGATTEAASDAPDF